MALAQAGSSGSLVGAILSRRWRLVAKLGEGGMGEVYAADPVEAPGPRVAVKMLRQEFHTDPTILARFLEEAKTSVRLVHPNIVRVLEGAQAEDGSPYFVMELLEGVPLGAYTQNGGRVPVAQAAPILQGILAGLGAAHARGIVHRDLKPDNVLLTRDGGGAFMVKLLDFGIAKVMDAAGGMTFRTRTGMLLGTPAYMSPEQARNAREVDARADLWSAGVLFYEMLTGRQAFPAPTEYARLAALLSVEPEPIERIDPSLTPLSMFIQRALKKDRNERFGSAQEMSQALAALVPSLSGRPSTAPPLTRLPDVHPLFGPQAHDFIGPPPTAASPAGSGERVVERSGVGVAPTAAMASFGDTAKTPTPQKAPGGTLNSPSAPLVVDPPLNVAFASPKGMSEFGETLPSKDGRIKPKRREGEARAGVSPALVVVLVLVALAAGFLLGYSVGRM
ncbi:MAG TPA: serine/threonine-protein kinase [Polyangiaceae bacterium]|jgi:serine/threonine-protein kinase|nr:serine/threonine-protein kinase [Polyangiaceae bacterium]